MSSNIFQRLVDLIGSGSQAELTRQVNAALPEGEKVSPQAVFKWAQRIPSERVLLLERLSRGEVSRHEMRPDIFGTAPAPADKAAA